MSIDKVSIIVPCYNSEKYVLQALNSALEQTWRQIEVIVVDDGSTDNTVSLIESMRNDRISFFRQEHKGACCARNFGAAKATGKYLQFLDSDDMLLKDKIASQMEFIAQHGNQYIPFCKVIGFKDGTDVNTLTIPPSEPVFFVKYPETLRKKLVITSGMLLPREVFEKNGGFDERLKRAQEHDFNIRLSSRGTQYLFDGTYQVLARHHNAAHRISNLSPISCLDSDLHFLDQALKYADEYLKMHQEEKDIVLNELISLNIFFAQQLGNFGEFAACRIIEERIGKIRCQFQWNNPVHYKAGKQYNLLLNVLGLTNFERLRHVFSSLRKQKRQARNI